MSGHQPAMQDSGWKRARRILAIRLGNMGDVLMTTPALAAIRHTLPHAQLTLLTSPIGVGDVLRCAEELLEPAHA